MATIRIGKYTYTDCDVLYHGDYADTGSVGLANVRTVLARMKEEAAEYLQLSVSDAAAMERAQWDGTEWPPSSWTWPSDGYDRDTGEYTPMAAPTVEHAALYLYGPYGYDAVFLRCDAEAPEWCRDIIEGARKYLVLDDDEVSQVECEWQDEALPDVLHELRRRLDNDEEGTAWNEAHAVETLYAMMDACGVYWTYESNSAYLDIGEECYVWTDGKRGERTTLYRAWLASYLADG